MPDPTIIFFSLKALISVVNFVVNSYVIIDIHRHHRMKTDTSYVLISHLAIANILLGLTIIPAMGLVFMDTGFLICLTLSVVTIGLANSPIMLMAFVSVERALLICCPYYYKREVNTIRVLVFMIVVWGIYVCLWTAPFMWNAGARGFETCSFYTVMSLEYLLLFNAVLFFLLPFLIMCICYISIMFIIRRINKVESETGYLRYVKSKKLTYLEAWAPILVVVMLILPKHLVNLFQYLEFQAVNDDVIVAISVLLHDLHAVVNPFLYATQGSLDRYQMTSVLHSLAISRMEMNRFRDNVTVFNRKMETTEFTGSSKSEASALLTEGSQMPPHESEVKMEALSQNPSTGHMSLKSGSK